MGLEDEDEGIPEMVHFEVQFHSLEGRKVMNSGEDVRAPRLGLCKEEGLVDEQANHGDLDEMPDLGAELGHA